MRGDESGLGTPEEDLASVAALAGLAPGDGAAPECFVASIGFGVDAYHGVSHGLVLENIAALERDGAYLGRSPSPARRGRARCSSTPWPTPKAGRRTVPAS